VLVSKNLVQDFICLPQILHVQDAKGDNLLDHIKKVKALADELVCSSHKK
jgi:HD superfamily phosphodiesterase